MKIKVGDVFIIPVKFKVKSVYHYECGNVHISLAYRVPYNHPATNMKSKEGDLKTLEEETSLEIADFKRLNFRRTGKWKS